MAKLARNLIARRKILKYFICLSITLNIKNLWDALTIDNYNQLHSFLPDSPLKFPIWDDVWTPVLGSPKSTVFEIGKCKCFLNSMDCLDFLECIPNEVNQSKLVREGVTIRQFMKERTMNFSGDPISEVFLDNGTVSFGIQAITIAFWRRWITGKEFPVRIASHNTSFVNALKFSSCRKYNLQGWMCFLHDFEFKEEFSVIEENAFLNLEVPKTSKTESLERRYQEFRENVMQSNTLDYLLMFSHVSRIFFNLRPHLLAMYSQRLKTIDHNHLSNEKILRVALQIRRGDACRFRLNKYQDAFSLFNDEAQFGEKRLCYANSVYMDSLLRVMNKVDRHVVVYLSTDYSSSFLEEISSDPELSYIYLNASWKYVDYPRPIFHYAKSGILVTDRRNEYISMLGESAFLDIWHLSHGQTYIGHLGSRFGKVSWIQAIGRNNAFVPFFSVDGRSICCELDESCESMDRFVVSMENCLSIFWPLSKYKEEKNNDDEDYDSPYRAKAAEVEVFYRIEKANYSKSEDTYDFVGSPNSKIVEIEDCSCDIVSVDCLHMISCMRKYSNRFVHVGILFREVVRQFSNYESPMNFLHVNAPIGMGAQYVTISVWKKWLSQNSLPRKLISDPDRFVNESNYPYCVNFSLQGRDCFLNEFISDESHDSFESEVLSMYKEFRDVDRSDALNVIHRLHANPYNASTLDYLLAFSHISRITFDLRPHMLQIYNNYLEIIPKVGKDVSGGDIRVAMHLRRGDACMHETTGYEMRASPLHSPAQTGAYRLCYDTQVYMKALQRILEIAPDKNIIVYISTDHLGVIMDEIKNRFPSLYKSVSWKYLKYPRTYFNYNNGSLDGGNYIESPDNMFSANLGEAAVTDIWHLSHGQIFIGHLGSRFGKLAWWQATAKYNTFIPFFSVDGHSICCDIDEACGLMSKYIVSMENCMGIFWPGTKYASTFDEDAYFSLGAHFRKKAAAHEIRGRILRNSSRS